MSNSSSIFEFNKRIYQFSQLFLYKRYIYIAYDKSISLLTFVTAHIPRVEFIRKHAISYEHRDKLN